MRQVRQELIHSGTWRTMKHLNELLEFSLWLQTATTVIDERGQHVNRMMGRGIYTKEGRKKIGFGMEVRNFTPAFMATEFIFCPLNRLGMATYNPSTAFNVALQSRSIKLSLQCH